MATSVDALDLPLIAEGKVRRLYRLPEPGRLLMVATDRISAYDHILSPEIPDKGKVLTGISLWWFDQLSDIVPNHLVSTDVPPVVQGRAMVVEELDMFPAMRTARTASWSSRVPGKVTTPILGVMITAPRGCRRTR